MAEIRTEVPSPCTSVCRMDPATGWCEGCLRTIDEIVRWSSLDAERRVEVWRLLGERRSTSSPRPSESTGVAQADDPPFEG